MGGNALAPFGAKRVSKERYAELKKEIFPLLQSIEGFHGWAEIPYLPCKDSFGDMDIVFTNKGGVVFDKVLEVFGNPPHVYNSNVLSVLFKELQVDLIHMPPEDYSSCLDYFSYNDLGNLIGKIYHKFGLKYGHRGLVLPLRDSDNTDHHFGELLISKDHKDIFEFLGLDYVTYLNGFQTFEEMFDYVMSSKYFDPKLYAFENMNSIARVRDKKRSTYNYFLKYIKGSTGNLSETWKVDKYEYIPVIFDYFPEAYNRYLLAMEKLQHSLKIKAKFNGGLIGEYTGLSGIELGHFMRHIKTQIEVSDEWILKSSDAEIKVWVDNLFRNWYKLYVVI